MTIEKLTLYRNIMYAIVLVFGILIAFCQFYISTWTNALNGLQREAQTKTLKDKMSTVEINVKDKIESSNKEQTDTLTDKMNEVAVDLNKNIESKNWQQSLQNKKNGRENLNQTRILKEQLELFKRQEDIKNEENGRLFDHTRDKLTDFFPSKDFSNISGQISRYGNLKELVQEAQKNNFSFISSDFAFQSRKVLGLCDIMKIHFQNQLTTNYSSHCGGKLLSGNELDNCVYDLFVKDFVDYLNLFGKVRALRFIELYEKNLKAKGKTTDTFLESLKKNL